MKRNLFIIALILIAGMVAGCVSTGGVLPPVAGQDSGFAEPAGKAKQPAQEIAR